MSCPTFSSQIVKDDSPTSQNWDVRLASSVVTTYKRLVVSESVPVDLKKSPRQSYKIQTKQLLIDKGKVNRTSDPLQNTVCDFRKTMGGIPQ
jgi:hypothetical protein